MNTLRYLWVKGVLLAALPMLPFSNPRACIGAEESLNQLPVLRIVKEGSRIVDRGRMRPVAASAFSPDGKLLAVLDQGKVEVWDVQTWKLLQTLPRENPSSDELLTAIAFAPDDKRIATGGRQRSVRIWDSRNGALLHTLTLSKPRYSGITFVAFSPDGETVAASGAERVIEIWHVASAKLLHSFVGHKSSVEEVAFANDGKTLVSGEDEGAVKWWDTSNGKLMRTLESRPEWVGIIVFSPDAKYMATGRDFGVKLWDARAGTLLHSIASKSYSLFHFSPDGTTFITGEKQGTKSVTVRFWDVKTGRLKQQAIIQPGAREMRLALSPDGNMLAGGYETGMVVVWQITEPR